MRSLSYIPAFAIANSYKTSIYKWLNFATNETRNLLRLKEVLRHKARATKLRQRKFEKIF